MENSIQVIQGWLTCKDALELIATDKKQTCETQINCLPVPNFRGLTCNQTTQLQIITKVQKETAHCCSIDYSGLDLEKEGSKTMNT